jgi:hypothetical protein
MWLLLPYCCSNDVSENTPPRQSFLPVVMIQLSNMTGEVLHVLDEAVVFEVVPAPKQQL